MSGVKGQSWNKDKVNMVDINSHISRALYEKIKKLANRKQWSISKAAAYYMEKGAELK